MDTPQALEKCGKKIDKLEKKSNLLSDNQLSFLTDNRLIFEKLQIHPCGSPEDLCRFIIAI